MFAQCIEGRHAECRRVLNIGYACVCDCPCHTGGKVPNNPCQRCHGTGKHGPWTVDNATCFRCGGSGIEPTKGPT